MRQVSKRYFLALVIVCAPLGAVAASDGCASGKHPLQVKILGDHAVGLQKSIALDVVLENIGANELELPPVMEPYYYWLRLEVKDQQGNFVQWRGPEVKMIYSDDDRIAIRPGYSYGRSFRNLERDLDLSKPGRYAIRAIWGIGPDGTCRWGKYTSREFLLDVIR